MAERVLVVIPTYNEIKNLPQIVPEALRQDPRIEAHRTEAAFEHSLTPQFLSLGHAGDPPQALRPIRAAA